MTLLDHLPHGRENATSVPALAAATGLPERAVRAEIERLVNDERVPIITLPTPGGSVYLATEPDDLRQVIRIARSRALGNLRRARSYRLCLERMEWEPELFPGVR